jgi:hypothetical protein
MDNRRMGRATIREILSRKIASLLVDACARHSRLGHRPAEIAGHLLDTDARAHRRPSAHASNLLIERYFQHSPRRRRTRWSQSSRQW